MKAFIMAVSIAFFLSGCATQREYLAEIIQPSKQVAVDLFELGVLADEFSSAYIPYRQMVTNEVKGLPDDEKQILIAANDSLVSAKAQVRGLALNANNPRKVLMSIQSMQGIATPIRIFVGSARGVLERNSQNFSPQLQAKQANIFRAFDEMDNHLKTIESSTDAKEVQRRLRRVMLVGRITLKLATGL